MATIRQYTGDDGPNGHVALLSDGRRVVIPSHHCLSVGDEFVDDVHSQEAFAKFSGGESSKGEVEGVPERPTSDGPEPPENEPELLGQGGEMVVAKDGSVTMPDGEIEPIGASPITEEVMAVQEMANAALTSTLEVQAFAPDASDEPIATDPAAEV